MALKSINNILLSGDAVDPLHAVPLRQLPAAFTGTISTSATTQAAIGTATTLNAALTLHNIARTGSWADLLNRPTLATSATTQAKITTAAVIPSALVLHDVARTGDYNDLLNKPTTTFTGTYQTSATTQATVGTATTLNAAIILHNIAKTGSWADLLNRPTLATSATAQATIPTAAVIPSALVLHNVARTGAWADILGKPTTFADKQVVKHWVITTGAWTAASPGFSYTIGASTAPITGGNLTTDNIDLTKALFLGVPAPLPSGTAQQNRDNAEALCAASVIVTAKTATSITLNAKSVPSQSVTVEIVYTKGN